MRRTIFLILFGLICYEPTLQAKDYKLINELPKKRAAALKTFHKIADLGSTPDMYYAGEGYSRALINMMKVLVKTYYNEDRKKFITDKEIDSYVEHLYAIHDFRQELQDPEYAPGTGASTEQIADVMYDLENEVVEMVESISADDQKFDFKAWKKKWEAAGNNSW